MVIHTNFGKRFLWSKQDAHAQVQNPLNGQKGVVILYFQNLLKLQGKTPNSYIRQVTAIYIKRITIDKVH